jgi:hypothetical protein
MLNGSTLSATKRLFYVFNLPPNRPHVCLSVCAHFLSSLPLSFFSIHLSFSLPFCFMAVPSFFPPTPLLFYSFISLSYSFLFPFSLILRSFSSSLIIRFLSSFLNFNWFENFHPLKVVLVSIRRKYQAKSSETIGICSYQRNRMNSEPYF